MIKNPEMLEKLSQELLRKKAADFESNLAIYESLYEEACFLGVLPLKNPLEGLEIKISLAKALNVQRTA